MCDKYVQPAQLGPAYAPTPSTLRQYNLSFPLVSKYPYSASPNTQKMPTDSYNSQQNPIQQYQLPVNDAFNSNYLKPLQKAKTYSFAPLRNYAAMEKAPLPITESQHDLAAVIANELEILKDKLLLAKKKKILIESAS